MSLEHALRNIVGAEHVLDDPDLRAPYETDWTRRFTGTARCVVRPGDTEQVAAVLRACGDAGASVVPQGGNTGMVGGSVPRGGEVVVSTRRLDHLDPVDDLAGEVTVGAGVPLSALQAHAQRAGWAYGIDFAARDSATVGGTVATNAGGMHVVRYGATRSQVVGIEAVLADGRVLSWLPGLLKDNTGYHLPSLLTGSEGTLAVITTVRVRLVPRFDSHVVALVGVDSTEAALRAATHLRRNLATLEAVELIFDDGVELVCEHARLAPPLPQRSPAYLVVEAAGRDDQTEALAAALMEVGDIDDAAVATEPGERERLWQYRERHTESINAAGVPHKLDVTLPLRELVAFEAALRALVAKHAGVRLVLFGHLGDGNLHVNLLNLDPRDERVDGEVLDLVGAHGGSISAEHGVGAAKVAWLDRTRGSVDIAAMTAIKRALDPAGLLNPGVLLPSGVG